jgi:hypothetical protein
MIMFRKATFAVLTVFLFAASVVAQSKPNFSGTWKLNTSKSDFGPIPGPTARVDVIEHNDPALTDSVNAEIPTGKQVFTSTYTTDGKEVVNKRGTTEVKSTLTWDGGKLVVNSKINANDQEITVKSVWSLSADGKTLTQNQHLAAQMGEADQVLVFEKQSGDAAPSSAAPSSAAAAPAAKSTGGAKANYSGTWKLNVAKSDFGPLPAPDTRTDVIDHKDPAIKVATTSDGPQGKQDFVLVMSTDGKEATNTPGGMELKSTGGWEGSSLVVNTKLKFQDNDIAIKSVWLLSDDGKTLTQNAHINSPMGELDQKMVFEKQ